MVCEKLDFKDLSLKSLFFPFHVVCYSRTFAVLIGDI